MSGGGSGGGSLRWADVGSSVRVAGAVVPGSRDERGGRREGLMGCFWRWWRDALDGDNDDHDHDLRERNETSALLNGLSDPLSNTRPSRAAEAEAMDLWREHGPTAAGGHLPRGGGWQNGAYGDGVDDDVEGGWGREERGRREAREDVW